MLPIAVVCGWSLLLLSPLLSPSPNWRPSHDAVPGSCPVTARTVQGMARVRSRQAPAWPLSSDRSVRRGSRIKCDFAWTFIQPLYLCSLSCGHSTLDARGADTYTQRAIPGPEPWSNVKTFWWLQLGSNQ